MTQPFEVDLEVALPASPDQVWEAIATGPGIDSWFMGRNEIEPREGGVAAMTTGGHREEVTVTGYEPGRRLAMRSEPDEDGRFMAFEYLIEGRDGGSTVLRVVHSGMLSGDWEEEYDALRRGWLFHLHTLGQYLAHFPGRTGTPVFAMANGSSAQQVREALARGLSLPVPVAVGARAHAEPANLPSIDGDVIWADDERFAVRTSDAIYTFHHGPAGQALMFHHLFTPDSDGADEEWQDWLSTLVLPDQRQQPAALTHQTE